MNLPRSQFSIRRLMIAVAIVGGVLAVIAGIQRRRSRFLETAEWHRTKYSEWQSRTTVELFVTPHGYGKGVLEKLLTKESPAGRHAYDMAWYHIELIGKYSDAAEHPWLPVAPDPPEPE